ncbi:ThyX-like thymidylate synthase [Streptomyces phage Izzy]|uniref:ThyX-like thymidylate synthase n=5 Tax=Likavirus izzy TaxID=1982888 RepID=A0A2U8UTK1_9CAUD|nr:thymidylate synthase [Streptomyces phage Izzy]ATE85005.1 ThyX-like thymidylate synthase [Streptomyces phage BryanRecycles]ATE85382.1 ThyX-like thymidylate synthase [Streptomyces phage Oliynyk]AWN07495.1 ThyX-like thymidylate synthase [Streptomyces phage Eddasa]QDK03983.1 ThyX-like thymidylate synthase [Streptomyces phage Rusticus]AKY03659.1 ThyX-like thymidylate synthase [Streptomyces phage Izzy]
MTEIKFRSTPTVQLVKSIAADSDVAMAARVSTIGGSHDNVVDLTRDEGLINFLMRDRHGSPFEHNSFTFYIEAPIFVAREFFRHRAGWSYNEESGRYKNLEPVFYVPAPDRPLVQVGKAGAYTFEDGSTYQKGLVPYVFEGVYAEIYGEYQSLLDAGIAREVARSILPVGIFTSFYATCNARSLMHFLSLRTTDDESTYPSFPQREIEQVAERMEDYFQHAMPITWQCFQKHGRVAP